MQTKKINLKVVYGVRRGNGMRIYKDQAQLQYWCTFPDRYWRKDQIIHINNFPYFLKVSKDMWK